jgi:hypothetical protein
MTSARVGFLPPSTNLMDVAPFAFAFVGVL